MEDKKKLASPESRENLYENMGKTIDCFSPIIKAEIAMLETLNNIIDNPISNTESNKISNVFLSLNTYTHFMSIELSSVLRACFRSSLLFEQKYNLKYINCVILEGYKHLYGYKSNRRKSIWMSEVKPLLEIIDEDEFKQDFDSLENRIIEFGKNNITDKAQRDLSFHYDLDPLLVYNMLIDIDEEKEVQRMVQFLALLQEISSFTLKYTGRYKIDYDINLKFAQKYAFSFSDLDLFQNNKDSFYLNLGNAIVDHTERLNSFVKQQGLPVWLSQQSKDIDEELSLPIIQIVETTKIVIQLMYIYIDLASVLRAFISSEYVIEKQLSLKQINIIVYEGFNKLYGLNGMEDETFLEKYIHPIILESEDELSIKDYAVLKQEFDAFGKETESLENKRQLSVHYDLGIVQVYNMLHDINPILEFQKALKFLGILLKILNISSKCLYIINSKWQVSYAKRMQPTYKKIDELINLLEKAPNTPEKEDIIKLMGKIKTGEFVDEIINKMKK